MAGPVTGVTFTDTGVTPGTAYFYQVAAANGAGQGAASSEAAATVVPPPLPPAVTATAGNALVTLSWPSSGAGVTYTVRRGTSPGGEVAYSSALTGLAFKDSKAANGTTYYYTVTATSAGGAATSPEVSATPLVAAPTLTTAKAVAGSVSLAWAAPPGTVTGYNVYRGTATGGEALLTSGATSTLYIDTTATPGATYFYRVTAVNGAEGAPSNELSATPLVPPAAPLVTAIAGNALVTPTWPSSGAGVTYTVRRGTSSGAEMAYSGALTG